jgi:general stress protein 26
MGDVKNLENKEALDKIKTLVKDINTCMFCTKTESLPFDTRPMATSDVDEEGNFWFFSNINSEKNLEIQDDDLVQLIYAKPTDSHFLSVSGRAEIIRDQKKIDELWNTFVKTWFQGGKDDPSITLIKVTPDTAYYWDTKHGKAVSLLKIAASVVTGKTMDDGIQGKISL